MTVFRKYIVPPILGLFFTTAKAQSGVTTLGHYGLETRVMYGYLIAHRVALAPLVEQHLTGAAISFFKTTDGSKPWEREFLRPEQGLHLAFLNPGSPERLGMAVALYPYLDFPLYGETDQRLWFRYGMGIGYVEKTFDPKTNYKNVAIGSHLNGVIHFGLQYRNTLSARNQLEVGLGITHFSNGSITMPNLGINMPAVDVGWRHYWGEPRSVQTKKDTASPRQTRVSVYAAVGTKQVYPALGPRYTTGTLCTQVLFPSKSKSDFGLGIDLFYDQSLTTRYQQETADSSETVNIRPGIHGAWQLRVNRIGIQFNLGIYPYTPFKGDGNFYHRIGLRYYFSRFFACVNLKTHYARADFIEWGLGWNITSNKH